MVEFTCENCEAAQVDEYGKWGVMMDDKRRQLINRLSRIEGQVKGIKKMIEEGQNCEEILMQVAAVKAAINKVGKMIFQTHFRHCLEAAVNGKQGVDNFFTVIEELLKARYPDITTKWLVGAFEIRDDEAETFASEVDTCIYAIGD